MAVFTASGATGSKADWSADGSSYTNIPHVTKWEIEDNPESKDYRTSSTNGAKRRLKGGAEFSGTIELLIDAAARFDGGALSINGGDLGYLKLYESTADFWIAPVYIESISVSAEIEDENLVKATISFKSDGNITYPT